MNTKDLKKTKKAYEKGMRGFSADENTNEILEKLAQNGYNLSAVIRKAVYELWKNELEAEVKNK